MLGSCHRHSNGYGYGTRVPTSRNTPGERSIPKHRYPHVKEEIPGSKPAVGVNYGEKSLRRHADQVQFQTSGDYGKFLFESEPEVVRIKMQSSFSRCPTPATQKETLPPPRAGLSSAAASSGSASSMVVPHRELKRPHTEELRLHRSNNAVPDLKKLDPVFPSHAKYDLIASTSAMGSSRELNWSIQTNVQGYMNSHHWRTALRNKK